ncbi:hypothetical protein ABZP36_010954 [Zizania latifolia]
MARLLLNCRDLLADRSKVTVASTTVVTSAKGKGRKKREAGKEIEKAVSGEREEAEGCGTSSPATPAPLQVIADNVGDIARMGSDLFGSYAKSSCAALVVASISSFGINYEFTPMVIGFFGVVEFESVYMMKAVKTFEVLVVGTS